MKSNFIKVISLVLTMVMLIISLPMVVSATQDMSANFYRTFTLTGNPATDVVRVAEAQLGRNRASMGYTEQWCADFVNDCAKVIGIPDNVIPHNYGSRGGCGYLIRYMLNYCNATVVTSPQTGDMVFWHCTTCDLYPHVGYVYDSLHSIEGNGANGNSYTENGHVIKRTLAASDTALHSCGARLVKKYVRPDYASIVTATLDAQGGTCERSFQYLRYGASIGTLPTPVKAGCTFNGWFSEKNGQGSKYTSDLVFWGLTDVTWYASWSGNANVIVASGSNDNITWTIDANGVLNITGTGEITVSYTPWKDNLNYRNQIKTIIIGEGITKIGNYTFPNITTATSVTIPSTVKTIGNQAFENCTGIKSIYLYDGVETIGDWAFGGCSSLESINIPDSITAIGCAAFQNCTSLKSGTLPAGDVSEGNTYTNCTSLTEIVIKDGVTDIGGYTFYNTAITDVTIPASVTSIGANAFGQCTNLSTIYYDGTEKEWESVTKGNSAIPEGVSIIFNESFFSLDANTDKAGAVEFTWKHNEMCTGYSFTIYHYGIPMQTVEFDGDLSTVADGDELSFVVDLRGGDYSATMTAANTASIILTEDVAFTVLQTIADTYAINAIYQNVSDGLVYVDIDVVETIERDERDAFIIAIYNSDGVMVDWTYMRADIPFDTTVTFGGLLKGDDTCTIKAFVWDSFTDMNIYSNTLEVGVGDNPFVQ